MIDLLGGPCVRLLGSLRSVNVHEERIASAVAELVAAPPGMPTWDHPAFPDTPGPHLEAVVVLGNAINFCYWVQPDQEAWSVEVGGRREVDVFAVFGALNNALEDGVDLADGRFLAGGGSEGPELIFAPGAGVLPLREERVAMLREVGRVLVDRFDGRLENAMTAAGTEASGLATFLAETFGSYGDRRNYGGVELPFLKRAQLAAGMLHGRRVALGAKGLEGAGRLTLYSDYMLPGCCVSWGSSPTRTSCPEGWTGRRS